MYGEQIDEDLEQGRLDAEIINNEVFASNTDPIQTSKDETSKNSSKHQTSPVTKTKEKKLSGYMGLLSYFSMIVNLF